MTISPATTQFEPWPTHGAASGHARSVMTELPFRSTVKWYDPTRRFGFLVPHDEGGEIYFNWVTLLKCGIDAEGVLPETEVAFSCKDAPHEGKNRIVDRMRIVI